MPSDFVLSVDGLTFKAWVAERSAQDKEEPAQRAGDTEQNPLPLRLCGNEITPA